ncbi:TlpA disulfide reductase family protein [Robertkochia solimangrovi]|uniref:TlpA disulfide reductase family protein n=1 Tax=Robertkochia solimangrovi TaxID=2213046 RepID=UPI00117EE81F|nr:TlpA disulfide reductase family protein [Robertkochia solimangrovi]TRZ41254.1 hypothetical protein DMZ48_17635 [Robertkochia solimangrovi]
MYQTIPFFLSVFFLSCSGRMQHPEYLAISGKISNASSQEFYIDASDEVTKTIMLEPDGSFQDTLAVGSPDGILQLKLNEGNVIATIYAENGADMYFQADLSDFRNTLHFTQDLAGYNNYRNDRYVIMNSKAGYNKNWVKLDKKKFTNSAEILKDSLWNALHSYADVKATHVKEEEDFIEGYMTTIYDIYEQEHSESVKYTVGKASPKFENFENYEGTTTSLSDLKGNFVFIDVWATWCKPCKKEFPYLEALQKEYTEKNIIFVSISIDRQEDKENWKKAIRENALGGIQLITPNGEDADFLRDYSIRSIPRFILIDPEGIIIDYNTRKPSETEALKEIFSRLKM